MLKDVLLSHMEYTRWASTRLVAAASELTNEERTRDFGTVDRSVLGTLVHIFAADRVWMGRITGDMPARFIDPDKDMHFSVLQTEWLPLLDQWVDWVSNLPDSGQMLRYQDLQGHWHESPAWQIVLHLVNHATHHRGQVQGFLRAMGRVPQPLDLIAYYREKSAKR